MTPTESRLLNDFLAQLRAVDGVNKDPEAAALIADALAHQPDGAYLLVQRALLQDQAMAAAGERIASLEAQLRTAPAQSGSFLAGGGNAWGRSASAAAPAPAPSAAAAPAPMPAPLAPVQSRPGFLGGGGGSFLGTMAATAAGVAGGALLFQGIGGLMGHHGAQAAPFGGMADSVDKSVAAPEPVAATEVADTTNDDSDMASDDSDFGGDDSVI